MSVFSPDSHTAEQRGKEVGIRIILRAANKHVAALFAWAFIKYL